VFGGLPPRLRPQLGVAAARFTACAAALRAEPGEAIHVPAEDAAGFLAEEPLHASRSRSRPSSGCGSSAS